MNRVKTVLSGLSIAAGLCMALPAHTGGFLGDLINSVAPGVPVEQMFKNVRAEVERETGRRQSPREESSLTPTRT